MVSHFWLHNIEDLLDPHLLTLRKKLGQPGYGHETAILYLFDAFDNIQDVLCRDGPMKESVCFSQDVSLLFDAHVLPKLLEIGLNEFFGHILTSFGEIDHLHWGQLIDVFQQKSLDIGSELQNIARIYHWLFCKWLNVGLDWGDNRTLQFFHVNWFDKYLHYFVRHVHQFCSYLLLLQILFLFFFTLTLSLNSFFTIGVGIENDLSRVGPRDLVFYFGSRCLPQDGTEVVEGAERRQIVGILLQNMTHELLHQRKGYEGFLQTKNDQLN